MNIQQLTSDDRKRKVSSTNENKSSITNNCQIDAKRRPYRSIDQSDKFGPNHLEPCLVTARVSDHLRPVFKDAAEALQKITDCRPNVETKLRFQDEEHLDRRETLPMQKIQFVSSMQPADTIEDLIEESQIVDLEKCVPKEHYRKISTPDIQVEGSEDIDIETPQSPVPSSPVKHKFIGLQIPSIDPQGHCYISWLVLVTVSYIYNAWCIPLRATFPYQTPDNVALWMTVDYFSDIIYIIDAGVVKPRLMFLNEGFWVDDPKETKKYYWNKTQFKFDVISLLPLDLLYIYFGPERVILRFPRMLKLHTFWEFHQTMDRVLSSPYVVRIGKMLFYIFYLIHLNACAYYAMSSNIGLASNEWVYNNEGCAYLRCFYFATKTATSIGKNPKPENTEEYLYMTGAWLMGVFVFAILIGQIRDIIATATRARTEYRKKLDGCTQYLRRLNMPASLQRRVASWYDYTWKQQRCFDESKILNSLPYNMKRDVALEVHMSTLSKVQLFHDCSNNLLRDLVLQLRPVSYLPGDVVVRRGEVGHDMYIVKSGQCLVLSQDENEVLATLKEGSVFGEISLLGIDGLRRRTATVRSRGFSSLFALSRADLDTALTHHKEAAQILRIRADQIIRENAERQAKQRLERHEAKKLARSSTPSNVRRRLSTGSSNESSVTGGKRRRSAVSGSHSKKRLSVVSENQMLKEPGRISLASAVSAPARSGVRTPIPTIVFTSEEGEEKME